MVNKLSDEEVQELLLSVKPGKKNQKSSGRSKDLSRQNKLIDSEKESVSEYFKNLIHYINPLLKPSSQPGLLLSFLFSDELIWKDYQKSIQNETVFMAFKNQFPDPWILEIMPETSEILRDDQDLYFNRIQESLKPFFSYPDLTYKKLNQVKFKQLDSIFVVSIQGKIKNKKIQINWLISEKNYRTILKLV